MGKELDVWRRSLVVLSVLVSSLYLVWRAGTLNPEHMWFSLLIYGAEVYGFITSLLFYFMVWSFPERKPKPPRPGLKVDVFIPTLNEPLDVLRKTILGCLNMRYPHRTYVLDDGNRPEVKKLCEELGCGYITRESNRFAKAGNLNNALKYTDGDFIAIFDADHVPQPDFLEKTLGYFEDEKVAFVQTPQEFYNVDSFQHRRVKGRVWHEQALFFRVIMRGKDRLNSAFFCGSCAVIRRKALEDIGGFAVGTVTEDLHTSIKLHSRGWKSVYHPEPLAYGIAPSTLRPYKTQRERWGRGAMQVFLKDNPITVKGLNLSQRLSYVASMITYFDGFQKLIYYVAPVVVLLTGIYPIRAELGEFLLFFVPHIVLSLWSFEEMARGYGRFLILEQYNMMRFFTFMKSVLGFLDIGKVRFKVTDKKINAGSGMGEVLPQLVVVAGSLVGIVYGALSLSQVSNRELYIANMFWASLNLSIGALCLLWTFGRKVRRTRFRFPANIPVVVRTSMRDIPVTVGDLHEEGASLITSRFIKVGEEIELEIGGSHLKGKVLYMVVKDGLRKYGIRFTDVDERSKDRVRLMALGLLITKLMRDRGTPPPTPLERFFSMWRFRFSRRRKRIPCQLPGVAVTSGSLTPFSAEDVSPDGLRVLTMRRIRDRHLILEIDGRVFRYGKVVWEKEISVNGFRAYRYGIMFLGEAHDRTRHQYSAA